MQTIRFLALGLGIALSVVPDGSATAAPDTARDQVWAAEVRGTGSTARTIAKADRSRNGTRTREPTATRGARVSGRR